MVVVRQAQPDTATFKALNPRWQATPEVEFLRSMEYSLRWLQWAQTRQGSRGLGSPKPIYWPWEREKAARDSGFRGDPLPWEQVLKMLGHDKPDTPVPDDKHRAFQDEE